MSGTRVVRSLEAARALGVDASVVTLGVFDGVHRGHRRIVETLLAERSARPGTCAWLLTFDPHPVVVTGSREAPPILSTIEERVELLAGFDLDGIFVVPFDETTRRLRWREFLDRFLREALSMRHLVLGYDCHFGYRREGSPARVREVAAELGFGLTVVDPVEYDGEVVSSTAIRNALLRGDIERGNALLGHPYRVVGRVVPGAGRGRDLGFPTANVAPSEPSKLWPPAGVYAVRVRWRGRAYDAMMNVGTAPTLGAREPAIEVHLFDFDHVLYGERLSIDCIRRLRDERRFASPGELVEQLVRDRETARSVLARAGAPGE